MSLFDFLRPRPQPHTTLGPFHYSWGRWHGTVALSGAERIRLHLPGPRGGPRPEAVRLAEQLASWWTQARPTLQAELYAHYCAGRDGGLPDMPDLPEPGAVWPHVTLSSVEVAPYGSLAEAQVALRVSWDEEHTLGALLRDGRLVELNGSILEAR